MTGPSSKQLLRLVFEPDAIFAELSESGPSPFYVFQAAMFPNLTDDVWQWGGSPAQIEQSIRQGRNGVMVPWGIALGKQGVDEVVQYVLALGGGEDASALPLPG